MDKRSNVPLYDQIKDYILLRILERKIKKGDILPSIDQLSSELEIPRQVVKMAYDKLIDQHLIIRLNQNYVIHYLELPDMFHKRLMTMTEAIESMGLKPSIETYDIQLIDDPAIIAKMQFDNCSRVLKIKRVYRGDDLPIFLVEGNFPLSIFPDMDKLDLSIMPFYHIFKDYYQLEITESYRIFTVVNTSQEISERLNITKGMPVYYSMTTAKDQYDRHIEYGQIWALSSHRIPMTLEASDIESFFR